MKFSCQIDHTGQITQEAFFKILNLHGISLTEQDRQKLPAVEAGLINYKQALQEITLDVQQEGAENWTLYPKGSPDSKLNPNSLRKLSPTGELKSPSQASSIKSVRVSPRYYPMGTQNPQKKNHWLHKGQMDFPNYSADKIDPFVSLQPQLASDRVKLVSLQDKFDFKRRMQAFGHDLMQKSPETYY